MYVIVNIFNICVCTGNSRPDNPSSISLELKLAPVDDEKVKFVAGSYCSGDHESTISIAVNFKGLHVTPSLSDAILHLRANPQAEPKLGRALFCTQIEDTKLIKRGNRVRSVG
jgi:hypothetical protein